MGAVTRRDDIIGWVVGGDEYKNGSDVDFFVEFEKGADLFDLVSPGIFLEEEFGSKVDVVYKRAISDELNSSIFSEVDRRYIHLLQS